MKRMEDKERDELLKQLIAKVNPKESREVSALFFDLQSRMYQMLLDAELEEEIRKNKEEEIHNKKNGYSSHREIETKEGKIHVDMPRDRNGTFEPVIIKKKQRVLDDMSDVAILMYSKGNSLNDIHELLKELYGIKLSKEHISNLIEKVSEDVQKWQERKLQKIYPMMYIDCLYYSVKKGVSSSKVAVYVIIGIGIDGKKEVVGIWIGDGSEAASYWVGIFEELKTRGVEDILYVSLDGLKGLKDGIEKVYPMTKIQRCVVHLCRNLFNVLPRKGASEIMKDFKKIYTSLTPELGEEEYNSFIKKYKDKPNITKKVTEMMEYIRPLFYEPENIRKLIYTTNAIESVNSCLRRATNGKGMFMNENSLMKVLFLRIQKLEKKWSVGTRNWRYVLAELVELYGERISKYL